MSIRTVMPVVAEEPLVGSSEFWSDDASALASSDMPTDRDGEDGFSGNLGTKPLMVSPDTCHLSIIINILISRAVIYYSPSFS